MAVSISSFELVGIFRHMDMAKAFHLAYALKANMALFGINSQVALAHFISQAGHESNGFKVITENLNYGAEQLVKIWPKRFSTKKEDKKLAAADYARNPEKIANAVYAKKSLGNGTIESGDGWKYRGRGFFQLTGKNNYKAFQTYYNKRFNTNLDLLSNPDLVATDFNLALISALWYFEERVMKKTMIETASVEKVTFLVNGGHHGLEQRRQLFQRTIRYLNGVNGTFDLTQYVAYA
ncbi:MAG TPA: glycoside hydrolase family 19 protein [Flavisolibacter sp.]|nr:glycoside hydrolase family 19 protein [Flavisolibacter sp.]